MKASTNRSLAQAICAWACCSLSILLSGAEPPSGAAPDTTQVIWSIGKPDGYGIEFAPGARPQLTFTIGKSVPAKEFAGHHQGSTGFDGQTAEKPYAIHFDLPGRIGPAYHLVLDLLYKSGAPRQIQVQVNDRRGIFPVRHSIKKSGDGEEANMMLLASQRLIVPIDGAWLMNSSNLVAITPLGLGAMDYDALTFRTGPGAGEALRLEPTIFFRKRDNLLVELCELAVPFSSRFQDATASVQLGQHEFQLRFGSGPYDFGVWTQPLEVPASVPPGPAAIRVDLNGTTVRAQHEFKPAKQWKVFVCPKVHNDVGYTDLQPHVNELDNRNTDRALDIMDRFSFYKFNFETSWLVDNYLNGRTELQRERFFSHAVHGRATINAFYLNLMTGLSTGEELYRAMYFTHRLHQQRGSSFDFACLTDAPSHSWFLPSLLTDVGVKAFSNGSNQTRAPILHFSNLNEESPFWWEGPNGERILFWFARSYTQWKRLTGPDFISSATSYDYMKTSVPQFLVQFRRDEYAPDAVMVYGAYVDNAAIPLTGEAELMEQWNREFEFPKLVIASDAEYFAYVEKNFGDQLATYRGDCGAYWEDGAASSAEQTRLNRHTQQLLPAGEISHSLATLFDPRQRYPREEFNSAWNQVMFYNEHTWGAHNSVSQPDREFVTRQWEIKEAYATRANLDARNLLARGFNRLCQNIAVEGDTLFAFNWQNWPRTEALEVELNSGQSLFDLTKNATVPLDVISEKDGWKRVRFLAEDIPPLGYKGYAIRGLSNEKTPANQPAKGETIESAHYQLTVDLTTGGLKSVIEKRTGRELVDSRAARTLNQYVYVTGGEGSLILNHTFGTPPAKLIEHAPGPARVIENLKTPLGHRIVVLTSCSNAPTIRSEYLLYNAIPRIDIVNTVEKKATRAKEACYFAFPFAAQQPAFEFQIQNAWCRPNDDQLPGACREWFTPQNVVHLRDGRYNIAWATPDTPLVCLTDINRGQWLTHLPINNGHIYSYAMHNYWFTNYRAEQEGTLKFRYSIISGEGLTREQLARFDADTRGPVLAYPFVSSFSAKVGGEDRPLSPASGAFLGLDAPNLQWVTCKAAEDGDGFIVRFREVAGRTGAAELSFPTLLLKEAHLCNGVEVNRQQLSATGNLLRVPYTANQFVTVRIKADSALNRALRKTARN